MSTQRTLGQVIRHTTLGIVLGYASVTAAGQPLSPWTTFNRHSVMTATPTLAPKAFASPMSTGYDLHIHHPKPVLLSQLSRSATRSPQLTRRWDSQSGFSITTSTMSKSPYKLSTSIQFSPTKIKVGATGVNAQKYITGSTGIGPIAR